MYSSLDVKAPGYANFQGERWFPEPPSELRTVAKLDEMVKKDSYKLLGRDWNLSVLKKHVDDFEEVITKHYLKTRWKVIRGENTEVIEDQVSMSVSRGIIDGPSSYLMSNRYGNQLDLDQGGFGKNVQAAILVAWKELGAAFLFHLKSILDKELLLVVNALRVMQGETSTWKLIRKALEDTAQTEENHALTHLRDFFEHRRQTDESIWAWLSWFVEYESTAKRLGLVFPEGLCGTRALLETSRIERSILGAEDHKVQKWSMVALLQQAMTVETKDWPKYRKTNVPVLEWDEARSSEKKKPRKRKREADSGDRSVLKELTTLLSAHRLAGGSSEGAGKKRKARQCYGCRDRHEPFCTSIDDVLRRKPAWKKHTEGLEERLQERGTQGICKKCTGSCKHWSKCKEKDPKHWAEGQFALSRYWRAAAKKSDKRD